MGNNNRNEFVVEMNMQSNTVSKTLSLLGLNLENVIETERDKVFEIADLFKSKNIDFWKDGFILRDIVLSHMSLKALDTLECLYIDSSIPKFLNRIKEEKMKRAISDYKTANNSFSKYDISKDFYRLVCDYSSRILPISDQQGVYLDLYEELAFIGSLINAVETSDYNDEKLFSILKEKEYEAKIFKEIDDDTSIESLNGELGIVIEKYMKLLDEIEARDYKEFPKHKKVKTRALFRKK